MKIATKSIREKASGIRALRKMYEFVFRKNIKQYLNYIVNRRRLIKILGKEKNKERKQLQFPSNAAIFFVGTQKYINYFPKYYENLKEFFLPKTKKTFFVFTDMTDREFLKGKDIIVSKIKHDPMMVKLESFKYMNRVSDKLKKFNYIMWVDADILANGLLKEQDFFFHNKPLFGVQHPNFLSKQGTFEKNPDSLAFVESEKRENEYIQACFLGGKQKEMLKMIKELANRIENDFKRGVIAKILDESHLNKYFVENRDLFYVYNPSYAYPRSRPFPKEFREKIIHGREPLR